MISKAIRQKSGIHSKWLEEIVDKYPQLNPTWLLTGKGSMLLENERKEVKTINDPHENDVLVPVYNIEASAGIGFLNGSEYIMDQIKIPFAEKGDVAISINGDSMYPVIDDGDLAVIRQFPFHDYVMYGNIYVIVTDEASFCKVIKKSDNPETLLMRSLNKEYEDFEIPIRLIRYVYLVVGVVRMKKFI
ncbi:S24 family peptidase [Algivirga pacifica]